MKFALPYLLLASLPTIKAQCPTLLWSDEFNGDSLDDSKWSFEVGDGCDHGLCGWGNDELQFYKRSNLEVSDGTLKITAKYNNKKYTSARITSLGKADFDLRTSLRIESSLKVPKNSQGLWPALWMMPSLTPFTAWPAGGEIDIMDFIGREANQTYGQVHYGEGPGDQSHKGALLEYPEHAGDYFHEFVLEKTPNRLTWIVDGQEIYTLSAKDIEPKYTWPFENVFHLILNMAVGGNWPEDPDATTEFPATFEVDYIRVYDLGSTEEPSPQILGDSLVHVNDVDVRYCVDVGDLKAGEDYDDTKIEWWVPPGSDYYTLEDEPNCVWVNFGTESGYVETALTFSCGRTYIFWLPIQVQDYYGVSYRYWAGGSQAQYISSTGKYGETRNNNNPEAPATITYERKLEEVYDRIVYYTDNINNPKRFVTGARKFYMDALSETAAPCTRFWIQLEDSTLATKDNYPVGVHSRYLAFMEKDGEEYQTLEFDYYDSPDKSVTKVDQIVILIDSFVQRDDEYLLKNFFQTSAGCTSNCMPLSTNPCQIAAKSEAGKCTDGFNNDGFGWNGDATTDCQDSDCYLLDPACQAVTPAPTPAYEICDDGIDNDNNGYTDCDDLACADSPLCGSWWNPSCSAYDQCKDLGLAGECCPTPHGEYLDCCGSNIETPKSCSVHPQCDALGLTGDCCPTKDDQGSVFLDCCEPALCVANPKCSGLDGACCPSSDGVFLECCEERPETCEIHPQCDAQGLTGECCPTKDGAFLDCCEPTTCNLHPYCAADGLEGECCPTVDGVFLDCCSLDMPFFEGYGDTGTVITSRTP